MAKPKTKSEIIACLAEANELSKKQAAALIEALVCMAYKGAKEGFTIPGLGKLVLPDTDPEEIPSVARNLGLAEEAPSAEVLASIHRLPYAPVRSLAFFRAVGLTAAPAANGGTLAGAVADVLQRARALAGR